jgi:hypothetical protein
VRLPWITDKDRPQLLVTRVLSTVSTKRKRLEKQKGRNQADSWDVDTLNWPQEQTNKGRALTRQEHKQKGCNVQASKNKLASNNSDITQMAGQKREACTFKRKCITQVTRLQELEFFCKQ